MSCSKCLIVPATIIYLFFSQCSSADLYIRGHFHEYVTTEGNREAKPLRIKAMESNLRSTDPITLQYCHLSKGGNQFEFPDKSVLDSTRIIITTTALARFFNDMNLPENYFSHILIDEASQMLECEALMALGLAGKNTRVVLAGDHMQMGPKLFSVRQDKCSEQTLLNRLFYYYQDENTNAAKQSRIIFSENYRSTKDIVDFVSTHFYVGKSDVIKAKGDVPSHPHQHALQFHHVRGECRLDSTSMSWFNPEQILSVVSIVQGIMKEWPQEWGDQDPESVCVLSQGRQVSNILLVTNLYYAFINVMLLILKIHASVFISDAFASFVSQVYEIRQRLRQLRLTRFTVENAENVQGKDDALLKCNAMPT